MSGGAIPVESPGAVPAGTVVPETANPKTAGESVTEAAPDGTGGASPLVPTATPGSGSHVGLDVNIVGGGGSGSSAITGPLGTQATTASVATTRAKSQIVAYGQITLIGGAPAVALAATTTWTNGVMIRNLDPSNKVYFGNNSSVTNANGTPLYAGEVYSDDAQIDPSTIFLYVPTTLAISYEGYGG